MNKINITCNHGKTHTLTVHLQEILAFSFRISSIDSTKPFKECNANRTPQTPWP